LALQRSDRKKDLLNYKIEIVSKEMRTQRLIRVFFSINFLLCVQTSCIAQDSRLIHSIEKRTRSIYDETDKQYWFLTKEKVIAFADTTGTEITAYLFKDTINRIVCTGYDFEGQWEIEFYTSNEKLIFIYYTKSFFEKNKTKSSFTNWKGYSCIELRIYYNNNSIISYFSKGIKDANEILTTKFPAELDKVLKWINKNI
jgi:hypothetical protein